MLPIMASLVGMLAEKGLNLISSAIDGGAEKAKDFIEEKTGIQMDKPLSDEEISKLKEFELTYELELKKLALEHKKEDNRTSEVLINAQVNELANARNMQIENLKQDDLFSKRFVYYFASFWSIFATIYILIITLMPIPEENIRFADTVLGFLLGTIIATLIGYFYGASLKKER